MWNTHPGDIGYRRPADSSSGGGYGGGYEYGSQGNNLLTPGVIVSPGALNGQIIDAPDYPMGNDADESGLAPQEQSQSTLSWLGSRISSGASWVASSVKSGVQWVDQRAGAGLSYVLTGNGNTGDSASGLEILSQGYLGVKQGELNTVNGTADQLVGMGNSVAHLVNYLAGYTVISDRAVPDFARNKWVAESDGVHEMSKAAGGWGVVTLFSALLGGAAAPAASESATTFESGLQALRLSVQAGEETVAVGTAGTTIVVSTDGAATAGAVGGMAAGALGQHNAASLGSTGSGDAPSRELPEDPTDPINKSIRRHQEKVDRETAADQKAAQAQAQATARDALADDLAQIGRQAATNTGRSAQTQLRNMAERAGLVIRSGGDHLRVETPAGRLVTTIPHSPHAPGTIRAIADAIIENIQ